MSIYGWSIRLAIVDTLAIEIDAGQDTEAAELVGLAIQLRQRLLELDVDEVESPATSAPPEPRQSMGPSSGCCWEISSESVDEPLA